jgi:hypothetical protein
VELYLRSPSTPSWRGARTIYLHVFINLLVILYGCETWSLTLREEHRLRVSEKRVLRRIFGPKREEVAGRWKKVHSEELQKLCHSLYIIRVIMSRRIRWAGNVEHMVELQCVQNFDR